MALIAGDTTSEIISCFYEVYNTLGFGFLEHIYSLALERELVERGHKVARERGILIRYKGQELGFQRLDMIVAEQVVVEIKSTFLLHPAARRQLRNYLKATGLEVGLLLHFGPEAEFQRVVTWAKDKHPATSG